MQITRRGALTGGATFAAVSGVPGLAAAQSLGVATHTFGPATAIYALGYIADAKGYFKGENLSFKALPFNAGTQGRQAVASGQALFGHGDTNHPLQLSTRGKPCKILFATEAVSSIANLVVRRDLFDAGIDTVEKLGAYKRPDGTKPVVAATGIGAGTWMYGTYLFEKKNLGDKINWVAGGGPNTMFPSLQTKQFDAIMAVPSWVVEAESKGFGKAIFDTSKPGVFEGTFGGTIPVLVVYCLEETIQQNKALVQGYVNAMVQAMRWVKATPLEDVYALVAEKHFAGIDPVAVKAELGFDPSTWAYDGRIEKAAWLRGGQVWYRKGTDIPETKYEDIIDTSFLETALAKYK